MPGLCTYTAGAYRPGPNGNAVSKWDRDGCARCGRSSHWAKECTATTTIDGGKPRDKPKKKKGGGKGRGLNDLEETGDDDNKDTEHGDADELLDDDDSEYCDDGYDDYG